MQTVKSIRVVNYQSKYRHVFRELNKEWIETYFKMEAADYRALDNPDEYILKRGGAIIVALFDDEPAGVCALLKIDDKYDYELAKMAVSPTFHGNGVGYSLGRAVIRKAKKSGAKAIYLESNSKLKSAINLYYKLGFTKVEGLRTPYERCNVQMELLLKERGLDS